MTTQATRTFGSFAPAMVTPFNEDGALDVESAVRLARKLVDDGCDAILLSGTTGESPTTHQPEKNELTAAVVEAVGREVFVFCGAGSNDTAHAVRIAQGAQEHGAHGLLVVTPYYNRPSQEGVQAHVRAIADAVDLPIMLYDIPGRTGLALSDETIDLLAHHPRIHALKDATGNVAQGGERLRRTGLEWYSGDDALNLDFLEAGGSGSVSVVGHVAAPYYRRMTDAFDRGDLEEARDIVRQVQPLVDAMMGGGQGAVMAKWAVYLQGAIASPTVRLPLVAPHDDEIDRLSTAMKALGLL